MERIGSDVQRELGRFGPQAGIAEVVERWPAAVGADIAANAWPARIARDGTLHVHTSSSMWAFELAHLEGEIRARLGDLAPPKLRFFPGPLPEREVTHAEPVTHGIETLPEDAERGNAIAAEIGDEKLRNLVARAAAASLARARSSRHF